MNKDIVLGVYDTQFINIGEDLSLFKPIDYHIKVYVSQDVIDFLEINDVEYTSKMEKLYKVNNIRYIKL